MHMILHTQPQPEGYPAKGYQFFGGDGPSHCDIDNDDNAEVGENEEHSPSGSTVKD